MDLSFGKLRANRAAAAASSMESRTTIFDGHSSALSYEQVIESSRPQAHSSFISQNEVAASINFTEFRKDFAAIKDRTVTVRILVRPTYS